MARKRRTSKVLEAAHQRLAGLSAITPAPNFGDDLTLTAYAAKISAFSTKLDRYNQMIAALDDFQNQVETDEADLHDTNKRMLAGVEAHYGPDSSQYEQAGGTPLRDRKRPSKKAPAKPTS
jgi:hypothetical protein